MSDAENPSGKDLPDQTLSKAEIEKERVRQRHVEWGRKRITRDVYEAIAAAWCAGEQNQGNLAARFGVSRPCINKLVHHGYPMQGWPSLKDREKLFAVDKAREREAQISAEIAQRRLGFEQARADSLKMAQATLAVTARFVGKMAGEMDAVTFKRSRWFKDAEKGWVVRELPAYGPDVAEAMSKVAEAIKTIADTQSIWFADELTKREIQKAMTKGAAAITAEQARFIIESGGNLPEGLSDEDLLGGAIQPDPKHN